MRHIYFPTKVGYEVLEAEGEGEAAADAERDARERERKTLRGRLIVAAALTAPLLLLEMVPMLIPGGMEWVHSLVPMRTLWLVYFGLLPSPVSGPPRWGSPACSS